MATLLRPNQIAEYEATEQSLEKKLHNRYIEDKAAVRGQLRRLRHNLDAQRPREPATDEKDRLVKETKTLLDEIVVGMPSHEEMRKCPPGAIDKHRLWEQRNKAKIQQWKNNQLRLHVGTDQVDIANLEVYRPKKSSLSMDNAFIPGTDYHLPDKVSYSVPFSDEDVRLLRERAPVEVWTKLPTLSSEQRTLLRQMYITTWELPKADVAAEHEGYDDGDDEPDELPEAAELADEPDEIEDPFAMLKESVGEPTLNTTTALTDVSELWPEEELAAPTPKKQSGKPRPKFGRKR